MGPLGLCGCAVESGAWQAGRASTGESVRTNSRAHRVERTGTIKKRKRRRSRHQDMLFALCVLHVAACRDGSVQPHPDRAQVMPETWRTTCDMFCRPLWAGTPCFAVNWAFGSGLRVHAGACASKCARFSSLSLPSLCMCKESRRNSRFLASHEQCVGMSIQRVTGGNGIEKKRKMRPVTI